MSVQARHCLESRLSVLGHDKMYRCRDKICILVMHVYVECSLVACISTDSDFSPLFSLFILSHWNISGLSDISLNLQFLLFTAP